MVGEALRRVGRRHPALELGLPQHERHAAIGDHRAGAQPLERPLQLGAAEGAQLELTLTTGALRRLLTGQATPESLSGAAELTLTGDPARLALLMSFLDAPDPGFEIVLP